MVRKEQVLHFVEQANLVRSLSRSALIKMEELETTGVIELSKLFDGIFTMHQSGEARVYELSEDAKNVYNDYCSQVVEEQNAKFQGGMGSGESSSSSSKDTKHVPRLSVILQILFHVIDKALGFILPTTPLPLQIGKENVQRVIAINEYCVDVKAILKEVIHIII